MHPIFDKLYEKFLQNLGHLQPFGQNPTIAIALSGGIDSVAMMLLTHKWAKEIKGQIVALTVNHNLRENSTQESIQVAGICKRLNIEHAILQWHHESINSNIQALARQARYNLLTKYCLERDIIHLFIGQQLDDSVENFFIKLSRGSGLWGIIDNCQNFVNNIRICRPIANFTKKECKNIIKHYSITHVEDISNVKTDYFRNEIRAKLANFFDLKNISPDLFKKRISDSKNYLADEATIIQQQVIDALCTCITIYEAGFAKIHTDVFLSYNFNIQRYLIEYLLILISATNQSPRAGQINSLLMQIRSRKFTTTTLNTCIISAIKQGLIIFKEKISIHATEILENNQPLYWDKRFYIKKLKPFVGCFTISSLNLAEYDIIKNKLCLDNLDDAQKHKKNILLTLPVIKCFDKIVALPNINYYSESFQDAFLSVFKPAYVSKMIHLKIKNF